MALSAILCSLFLIPTRAQTTWNEDFLNQPQNLHYNSVSPTRLSYNAEQNFAVARLNYHLQEGDFHALDASGHAHAIDAYVGGLRKIGGFSLAGHLQYQNRKDNEQRWNSTLWNLSNDPFILCDSVAGDATTESFNMQAAASYQFNDRLKAGLDISLSTGSRADQTNPRPKTTTSMLPITAGADYQLGDCWNIGLAAGLRLFSSVIEYTSTTNNKNHTYFLMKGTGDYARRSTGDDAGYKRDYQGNSYHAALNTTWKDRQGKAGNFLEMRFSTDTEEATDGGTSYSYHGGDYTENRLLLHDRLMLRPNSGIMHNITMNLSMTSGKGTWYEQKRQTDLEHGNRIYYEVLSKNTNHKSQLLTAQLQYRLDLLDNGARNLFFKADATMNSATRKQMLGDRTPKQEMTTLDAQIAAGKMIYINKVTLIAQLNGGWKSPLKQTYASGCSYSGDDDISAVYTRPIFEYQTAQCWQVGAQADVTIPVSKSMTAGAYLHADYRRYSGKNEYWQGYDGSHLTTADIGLYLQF